MYQYLENLQELKDNKCYRTLPGKETLQLLDLCSNDYMGINANVQMKKHFMEEYGQDASFSSCSSRLLGKCLNHHIILESEIASAYKSDSCLLFNSGYHANAGILPSLVTNKDLIIADKLIHASIIDGAKLGKADFLRYRHLDYSHLESLLIKNRSNYDNVFIVSESIFSMDGDIADMYRLIDLKQKYKCCLYIDEAHALGVRGKRGLGYAEEKDCISDIDFLVGTMGKAVASMGAFVVCNQVYKDYLINNSRPFIFSTALPPVNVAWSYFVFQNLFNMQEEREKLKKLSEDFAALLNIKHDSHIIPFVIGSNEETVMKSKLLKENGFHVLPIRYPTVPKNTARLRFSLSVSNEIDQLLPLRDLIT